LLQIGASLVRRLESSSRWVGRVESDRKQVRRRSEGREGLAWLPESLMYGQKVVSDGEMRCWKSRQLRQVRMCRAWVKWRGSLRRRPDS